MIAGQSDYLRTNIDKIREILQPPPMYYLFKKQNEDVSKLSFWYILSFLDVLRPIRFKRPLFRDFYKTAYSQVANLGAVENFRGHQE